MMKTVFYISSKENKVNRMVLKMAETQVNAKLSDNTSKLMIKPLDYIVEVNLLNKNHLLIDTKFCDTF